MYPFVYVLGRIYSPNQNLPLRVCIFVHIIIMSVPNMEEDRLAQHLCNVIIYVYHNRFNQGLTRLDKPLVQLEYNYLNLTSFPAPSLCI